MAPAHRLATGRPVIRHPLAGGHGQEAAKKVRTPSPTAGRRHSGLREITNLMPVGSGDLSILVGSSKAERARACGVGLPDQHAVFPTDGEQSVFLGEKRGAFRIPLIC